MRRFTPRLEILPPPQRRLWEELGSVPAGFVLYGGTALALRLGHRYSEDFDFFATAPFRSGALREETAFLRDLPQSCFVQCKDNTLTALVDRGGSVKVSFFRGLELARVEDPEFAAESNVRVASLLECREALVRAAAAVRLHRLPFLACRPGLTDAEGGA